MRPSLIARWYEYENDSSASGEQVWPITKIFQGTLPTVSYWKQKVFVIFVIEKGHPSTLSLSKSPTLFETKPNAWADGKYYLRIFTGIKLQENHGKTFTFFNRKCELRKLKECSYAYKSMAFNPSSTGNCKQSCLQRENGNVPWILMYCHSRRRLG